ncbi:MAG TPA: NAD(P)-dependent oxidoreductase [Microscillaceae bacterium]|nr:NAD(P)-dependent oxidoreductase [Microscillaceae bacterium]
MKAAINAASGGLGGAIAQATAKILGKENVIAVARTPEKAARLGLETRAGDYNNKAQLIEAYQGADVVLLVSSNAAPDDRVAQHKNVIEAAIEAGAKRVVFTSIAGGIRGGTFSPIVQTMQETEILLENSDTDWTIGRNGLYIEPDFESVNHYITEGKVSNSAGDTKCAYTSREELGQAYAQMIANEGHRSKIYNLTGPAITQQELVDIINETYGVNLTYEAMTVEAYEQDRIAELGEYLGKIISGIYEAIYKGDFNIDSDFEAVVGRPHETVREFFTKHKQ